MSTVQKIAAAFVLVPALLTCAACNNTRYHQRRRLQGGLMGLDISPSRAHFVQKCTYAREASVGGVGSSAGGGCGCY